MRSVQLVAPRTLELRDMPMAPDPGPGEVLVRVRAVGVCGSDMHWYLEGGIGEVRAVYPQVLGHEPAGEIVAAGPGAGSFAPGAKVAIEPAINLPALRVLPRRPAQQLRALRLHGLGPLAGALPRVRHNSGA